MDSLTLKRHKSFQNLINRTATHNIAPNPLIFKFQREILKFNDICLCWSSAKTGLGTNFLNLENRSFESVSFLVKNVSFFS